MNKELEALERLYKCNDEDYTLGYQAHDYKLLEQALQRLEQIDNSNPSEALEVLGYIGGFIIPTNNGNQYLKDFCDREFAIIKQTLIKSQELEKENARYKHLEEKLGIPLDIAFRALKEGIYIEKVQFPYTSLEKHSVRGIELYGLGVISNICSYGDCDFTCLYKDYKKSWWLKENKEE